jgi:hypothetical protein
MEKYLTLIAKILEIAALISIAAVFVIDKNSLEFFDSRNVDTQGKDRIEMIWLALKETTPESRKEFIILNDDTFTTIGKKLVIPEIERVRDQRNIYALTAAILFAFAKMIECIQFMLSHRKKIT